MRPPARNDDAQQSLFGDDTDAAVESVASHETDEWRERALAAVRVTAERNLSLTVLDVRRRCEDCDDVYDGRAWGSVMREGARRGYIRSTETYRPGPPETHGRPLLVWRSQILNYDLGDPFGELATKVDRAG